MTPVAYGADGGCQVHQVHDLAAEHAYPRRGFGRYSETKLANILFTSELARRLEGSGVTANVIHPGDVKTEMWADIRDQVSVADGADAYREWAEWVEGNGGDPPEKAAALVLRIVQEEENGRFLWIEDPLQAPIPSW